MSDHILETLQKTYDDAAIRLRGLGMANVYGLPDHERLELDLRYRKAQEECDRALQALSAFMRSGCGGDEA